MRARERALARELVRELARDRSDGVLVAGDSGESLSLSLSSPWGAPFPFLRELLEQFFLKDAFSRTFRASPPRSFTLPFYFLSLSLSFLPPILLSTYFM